ncbi:MAG: hypothetical protein AB7I29_03705 [Geobacter sp.]
MSKKLEQMTPQQIRERGRELLRLAKQKEEEVRKRQLIEIGEIFQREISNSWATPWQKLQFELQSILVCKIEPPRWGGQGDGKAPLEDVSNDDQ